MSIIGKNPGSNNDASITLGLLRAVHENERLTQRSVAQELGIALGLTNAFLKRCVSKGFIKIRQAPKNRYAYYLTPKGFAEKSRLTAEFLTQSLSLFRQSQDDYRQLIDECIDGGIRTVALFGNSDLCDVVALCAQNSSVELVGIIDPKSRGDAGERLDLPVREAALHLPAFEAIIFTELSDPIVRFQDLTINGPDCPIFVPAFLEILDARKLASEWQQRGSI
jgi:DNA-binding MarR family transcriptional regulator